LLCRSATADSSRGEFVQFKLHAYFWIWETFRFAGGLQFLS